MADYFITHADGYGHIDKDPDATLNYTWDCTRWLARTGNPTITAAEVTVPDGGITLVGTASITGGLVTQKISAGSVPGAYRARLRFTTSDAQTDERTIVLDIKER